MKQDQATNHNHAELTGPHEPRGTIDELPDEKRRPGSPQAVPAYSRAVELERVPVKLNRNFLNFPLARATRAHRPIGFETAQRAAGRRTYPARALNGILVELILCS